MGPTTGPLTLPVRHSNPSQPFEYSHPPPSHTHPTSSPLTPPSILKSYNNILTTQNLPPALAAISALTTALSHHEFSTASEALSLLSSLANTLKQRVDDPIPPSAGIDLFLHYLVNNVVRPSGVPAKVGESGGDFEKTVDHSKLIGQKFVAKGLQAGQRIATYGGRVITEGTTVFIPQTGPGHLIEGLLLNAATAGVEFRVVFVGESASRRSGQLRDVLVEQQVQACSIAVEEFASAVRSVKGKALVLIPAAAVLSDGGIWASSSTLQCCAVAKTFGMGVAVVSEMFRLVRISSSLRDVVARAGPLVWETRGVGGKKGTCMDIVPAELITYFLTESGIMTPTAIAEEAIKIWF